MYTKNPIMEYLPIDEENMAVFDNETRDTHYIGGAGKLILELIGDGVEFEVLLNRLSELYDERESEINLQTRDFLDELVKKRVIILK